MVTTPPTRPTAATRWRSCRAPHWLSVDGRTFLAPSAPESPDTRPLWLAVLLGLAAGIGLTLTASVVVSNLEHPES